MYSKLFAPVGIALGILLTSFVLIPNQEDLYNKSAVDISSLMDNNEGSITRFISSSDAENPCIGTINIQVNGQELLNLFQSDPNLGSMDNPFVANSFCTVVNKTGIRIDTNVKIKNTFVLDSNKMYTFNLLGSHLDINNQNSKIEIAMIREKKPKESDWAEIFVLDSMVSYNTKTGNLIVASQNQNDTLKFVFQTKPSNIDTYNLDYNIYFQIKDPNTGNLYYNIIDPLILNTTDEKDKNKMK